MMEHNATATVERPLMEARVEAQRVRVSQAGNLYLSLRCRLVEETDADWGPIYLGLHFTEKAVGYTKRKLKTVFNITGDVDAADFDLHRASEPIDLRGREVWIRRRSELWNGRVQYDLENVPPVISPERSAATTALIRKHWPRPLPPRPEPAPSTPAPAPAPVAPPVEEDDLPF